MKRATLIIITLVALFVGGYVLAQVTSARVWQDNEDGANFVLFDVGSMQANNLAGTGTRCAAVDSTGKLIPMSLPCGAVLIDSSDTSSDYLANKVTSSSPITLTVVPGGPPSAGLKVWLKSDAGVTSSSGNVSAWADQSGNGNNVTAGGSVAPVLVSGGSGINGLPVIRFTNSSGANRLNNCFLSSSINPSSWAGLTVLYVVRTAASGSPNSPVIDQFGAVASLGQTGQSVWWSFNTGSFSGGEGVGWAGPTGAVNLGTYSPPLTDSQIVYEAYQYDKTTWTMSGTFSTTAADTSFPTGSVSLTVGANNFTGGQGTDDTAEILVYDHKLSTGDMAQVTGYLSARYAITIPGSGSGGEETLNIAGQGLYVSGATTTTAQDLGLIATAPLGCVTSGGVCTVDGLTLSGGLSFNSATGVETLANFSCSAGQAVTAATTTSGLSCSSFGSVTSVTGADGVACSPTSPNPTCTLANAACPPNEFVSSASSASGLVCTQPSFANLSGLAACSQLPLDGSSLLCGGGFAQVGTVQASHIAASAGGIGYFDVSSELASDPTNFGWNDSTRVIDIGTATAPAAPGIGVLACWADSTGLDLTCKNTSGVVTHGVQTQAGAAHNFATSVSAAGAVGIAQPAFTDMSGTMSLAQEPIIAADTILANGTGLAAQAAQTSIGTTMAFDGTAQLQAVGLRDGGGVNHTTTGTWPVSSVITDDSGGHVTAVSTLACANLPVSGDLDGCGVTGLTDDGGLGTNWTTNGQTFAVGTLAEFVAGNHIASQSFANVAASVTKLRYSLQLQLGASTPNTWLLQGGAGLFGVSGAVVEVPNDFKSSGITIIWYLASNVVTAGTLSMFASLNGSGIAGTGFSITSATSTGVHVGALHSTGSTSSNDTYGLVFTTDGSFSSASPSSAFVTVEILLTP